MNQNNNQNNNSNNSFKPNQKRFDNTNSDYKNNSNTEYKKYDTNSDYNKNADNVSENIPYENKSKVSKSYLSPQNNHLANKNSVNPSDLNLNVPEIKKTNNNESNKFNIIKENQINNLDSKKMNNNKNFKKSENKSSDKPTYVSKQAFIGDRKKPKKVYADDYEQERDFKLNIYKKNIYATPYFQEKKRRNTFIGKKPKPKEEESWKKKHKKHSNKQND